MSMDLERKDYSCEQERFIAGATIPVVTAVKKTSAIVKAHAPVLLDTNQVKPVASSDISANLGKLYGIAAEDTASGADCVVYLTGEFFTDALALESEVTADKLEVGFRNIGIFLK